MKKGMRKLIGMIVCISMMTGLILPAAASNRYDYASEDLTGKLVFPGDSISNADPIYIGPDGQVGDVSEGAWTNRTSQAYEIGYLEEGDGLWLIPMGYVLTVKGGICDFADAGGFMDYNHFKAKEDAEESEEETVPADVAYFEAWTDVYVKAGEPEEGKRFDHWEAEGDFTLEDASSPEMSITMPEQALTLKAVYSDAVEAVPETEEVKDEIQNPDEYQDPQDDRGEEPAQEEYQEEDWGEEPAQEEYQEEDWGEEPAQEQYQEENWGEEPAQEQYQENNWEGTPEDNIQIPEADDPWTAEGNDQVDDSWSEEPAWDDNQNNQGSVIVIGDGEGNVNPQPQKYVLTVENGEGTGEYELGEQVTIKAFDLEGMVFSGWTTDADTVWFENAQNAETTFYMPAENVSVKATYSENQNILPENSPESSPENSQEISPENSPEQEDGGVPEDMENNGAEEENWPQLFYVEVINGEGDGGYEAGSEVTVYAYDAPEGQVFDRWITSDNLILLNAQDSEVIFDMPEGDVRLEAVYKDAESSVEKQPEEIIVDPQDPDEPGQEEILPETGTDEPEQNGNSDEISKPDQDTDSGQSGETEGNDIPDTIETNAPETDGYTEETDQQNEDALTPAQSEEGEDQRAGEPETMAIPEDPDQQVIVDPELETDLYPEETDVWEEETDEDWEDESDDEDFEEDDFGDDDLDAEEETDEEIDDEIEDKEASKPSYQIDLSDTDIQVEGAVWDDDFLTAKAGTIITIIAPEAEDEFFAGWEVTRIDKKKKITVIEDEEDYLKATFKMPKSDIYVEALYDELEFNEVQVINGTGSGTYSEGDQVIIEADPAPAGYQFKNWNVITGNVKLGNSLAAATTFIMPDDTVQVRAVYELIKYQLTVNNGSGSGRYAKGETVSLTANYPATGKEFAEWKLVSGNGAVISAVDRYYSSVTMPAEDTVVLATYKDGPSPAYNQIQNIAQNGEYLKGQTISFTAVGNGMENSNPNPGDYRYRPTGYQIGNVSGGWNNAPYTTSMAINAIGQYTLTVTFTKDVFDGSSWVPDGTTDTKSVTFNVVNALSVQTGDSSPILPLTITALAALAVAATALILIRRRRAGRR